MRSAIALTTFLFLLFFRAADLAVTFHFDPSLSHEGNPVVFFFGGSISSLLLANTLVWLTCNVLVFAFWRGNSLRLQSSPKSFREYLDKWYNRVVRARRPLRQSLPGGENWHEGLQAIRLVGLALSWAVIVGSAVAIHAWFAIQAPERATTYQALYGALQIGGLNYMIWLATPLGFAAGTAIFFWSEYRQVQLTPAGNGASDTKC